MHREAEHRASPPGMMERYRFESFAQIKESGASDLSAGDGDLIVQGLFPDGIFDTAPGGTPIILSWVGGAPLPDVNLPNALP